MQRPQIILLKEGTDTSQGKAQIISNINACQGLIYRFHCWHLICSPVIADAVRTTLGPRGMDKLIVDNRQNATISNDGATIMKLLDVVHPSARVLVDIAKSQDAEVGCGPIFFFFFFLFFLLLSYLFFLPCSGPVSRWWEASANFHQGLF